ncbi:hypothetical protein [Bradymonas sediminis]|uniref:Uncharacterized protein n=1 Tax=Bradymonas sediminis TaxID=1548548 RepID=A0A2Z4FPG2_9DELT|nr:hypothetical protein [Bradymonas sediminis]AWV90616.1 hypothetical protein DN745_15300 [Bradymonas sediminis]TDP62386.1 hypothetical protein DFR33_11349 [Bradymonas sediminis]
MEPVRIRPDVDPNSPEYKRSLRRVMLILFVLMISGGSCLGYRIRKMEEYIAERKAAEAAGEVEAGADAPSDSAAPGQPGAVPSGQKTP